MPLPSMPATGHHGFSTVGPRHPRLTASVLQRFAFETPAKSSSDHEMNTPALEACSGVMVTPGARE